jgi:hypothetical protein
MEKPTADVEITAMMSICDALSKISDEKTRGRVLTWVNDKFWHTPIQQSSAPRLITPIQQSSAPRLITPIQLSSAPRHITPSPASPSASGSERNELAGIAIISNTGDLRITARDLKAKSTNDAAIRLLLVTIRAHQLLLDQSGVSARKVIVPLLKKWRAYDGNTRNAVAKHRGIVRLGDELSLDVHAQNEADRYIEEINDSSVSGKWQPSSSKGKKRPPALASVE